MLVKPFLTLVSAFSAFVFVSAGPFERDTATLVGRQQPPDQTQYSLNNWGGSSYLDGFDNFYGYRNFGGYHNSQNIVDHQICHPEKVYIVQQRLAVLREMMKRIMVEDVCEVESQVILLQQHESAFKDFYQDIFRTRGRQVGYDRHVHSYWNKFYNSDGSRNGDDWNFHGYDIGQQFVQYDGYNWGDNSSSRCRDARFAALDAEGIGST